MIELYMIVCLVATPSVCEDKRLPYDGGSITPMQLMTVAQQEIAKWVREHPGWNVMRYGARKAGLEARA